MALLIGGVTARDTVFDDATLFLESPWGAHTITLGGHTFVYTNGQDDDGVSSFEVGSDGSLTNVQNIGDDATLELDGAQNFASATVGGSTYLFVNSYIDDGISAFRVESDGTLTNVDNITDGGTLNLLSSEGRMSTATVGGATYLVNAAYGDSGFSVFRIENDGTLTNTANENDTATTELNGPEDTAVATVDGRTFIFVAAYGDSGVSAYELHADGTVTNTDNVSDDATLNLDSAWGVATATVGGTTYLIASGNGDDGLSVFSVSGTGQLTNVFNVSDSASLGLDGASTLTAFTLDTESFVMVSGDTDDALTVFHVEADGSLTDVTTVFDSLSTALDSTEANTFAVVGGQAILIGTGYNDNGISTFDLGSGDDTLRGTADDDLVMGLAGNDDLNGAGGNDRVIGGNGDDHLQGKAGRDALLGLNGRDELLGGGDNDHLLGGGKADELTGGRGRDVMSGEGGGDDFIFTSIKDSGASKATRDIILDFGGRDHLVFTDIDADKGQPGNQDFTFDTDGNFTAGEIRFHQVAKGVLVEINVDSDSAADLSVLLKNFTGTLNSHDFDV